MSYAVSNFIDQVMTWATVAMSLGSHRVGIRFVSDEMIVWVYMKFWRFRQDIK